MTFEGNNRTLRRADTTGDLRLLVVAATGNLTINNLTLRNGRLSGTDGGAAVSIGSGGELTTNNSIFRDNTAPWGGAIAGGDATITLTNSEFVSNSVAGAIGLGGALSASGSSIVTVTGSSFRSNSAVQGSAIDVQGSTQLRVERSDFRNNRAEGHDTNGGTINTVSTGTLEIRASAFIGNRSEGDGGALSTRSPTTVSDSAFIGNQTSGVGGAITTSGETVIENSTFYGNRLTNNTSFGAALIVRGVSATLRHTTILNSGRGQGSLYATEGATLTMVNSVIAGSAGLECVISAASSFGTNINNWIEDGTCSPTYSGDPMLSTPRGSPAFIPPYIGSGLVDAAPDNANCLATDQRGTARPVGDACDIGAYEGAIPRPQPQTAGARSPTPVGSTCLYLPASIRVTGLGESTQCQQLSRAGIGAPALRDSFIDAVDIWSWVLPGTEVCFRANSGKILFIDTSAMPRAVAELPAYRAGGMTCATIDRSGQAVLMPGPSAPMQAVRNRSLQDCMVTTDAILMFRDGPAGALITFTDPWGDRIADWLPENVTLTALARTDGWFRVGYHGVQGWISADYVTTAGNCG